MRLWIGCWVGFEVLRGGRGIVGLQALGGAVGGTELKCCQQMSSDVAGSRRGLAGRAGLAAARHKAAVLALSDSM